MVNFINSAVGPTFGPTLNLLTYMAKQLTKPMCQACQFSPRRPSLGGGVVAPSGGGADGIAGGQSMEVGFYSLSFSDLMVWAVLIGDVELAEVFWASSGSSNRGDPIRLALIASQMSMRAAEVAILERADYVRNAAVFETWAIELLRKCDESDSLKLLLREHDHWPHTVLRIAMRGHPNGCKKFIGEAYVQRLVDRHWHGHTARATTWQIPEDVSSISIILHCFVRGHIKMTPPNRRPCTHAPKTACKESGFSPPG